MIPIVPEYINMSLKPAIGATFYEKFSKEIHGQDSVIIKGAKRKVPRYYDKNFLKKTPIVSKNLNSYELRKLRRGPRILPMIGSL